MLQIWVLHHLQIVGEAARSLSQEFREQHADRVWAQAIGMRNILVHHYFEIELGRVWNAVENDLPELRRKIEDLLQNRG